MPGSSLHNILSNLFSTPNFLGPDPRLAFWFEMKSKYPDLSDELINQMYSQLDVLDFNNLMGAASNVELPMLQEADLYSLNNTITLLSTDNLSKGALAILNGNLGASGENEESSTKGDKSLNINWNPNDEYHEWRELYVQKHATKKDSEGNVVPNENAERNAKRWTNAARTMKWVGLGSDIVSSFLPENTAYSGDKGEVASTVDQAYDSATNFLAGLGPYGLIASGALKGFGALNKGLSALGVGTDGMCVCAGTRVITANGLYTNIEDLRLEDGVIGWCEKTKQIVPQTIKSLISLGEKECLEIVLKSGRTIKCSIDHPILSDDRPRAKLIYKDGICKGIRLWKFRRADSLKVGDFVGIANSVNYWGSKTIKDAYVVGLLIGDGCYTIGSGCKLTTADKSTWDYIEKNNYGIRNSINVDEKRYNGKCRTYSLHGFHYIMKELGLYGLKGNEKTLPKDIHLYDKKSICNLIAGLFDTDGSIWSNKYGNYIVLYQTNKKLLEEVQELLLKLGIFCTIGKRDAADYIINGNIRHSKESYRLNICGRSSVILFHDNILLNIEYKKNNLEKIYLTILKREQREHNLESGAKLDKIVSITYIGRLIIYNLQTNEDHTYLANNIITHNTTMDSLMSSNLFGWNIGLVNSLGAKTTDKINKDYDTFALSGSSYTGTSNLVDEAVHKSDKKYGLFSGGAYNRALELIHNAQLQLQKLSDITKAASNRSALKSSMSGTNTVRRLLAMNGGYRQGSVRAGLRGMILMPRVLIANILNAAKGAKVNIMNKYGDNYQGTTEDGSMKLKNPYYQQYDTSNIISLPMPSATLFDTKTDTGADDNWFKGNQILRGSYVRSMLEGSSITPVMPIFDDGGLLEYDNSWIKEVPVIEVEDFDKLDRVQLILALIDAVKNMANPPRFILRLNEPPRGIWIVDNGILRRGSHIISSGIYEDMSIVVPLILEIDGKLVFIDDMREAVGRALESGNYLRFVNNELAKLFGDNYKIGWPELFNNYDEDVIMENEMPEKFLHGGKTNVIPDGALHKERHGMEKMDGLEDVTRKGIPVVSEEEGGEIVQQAEIERSELILRLEVTEKIEELYKTYYDDKSSSEEKDAAAIDAGKLLAEEIMHNTDDLTNNII